MKKVAFICVHNSCRSQIAEALGKHLASDVVESYSAGTETKPQINQDAVRIMKELYGIDMELTQRSKLLSDIPPVDIVITMGCNVQCPYLPCKHREDWGLEDPSGKEDAAFQETIRTIEKKILELKSALEGVIDHGQQQSIRHEELSKVFPLLVAKAQRKGRTAQEVEEVLFWLTGYDKAGLDAQLARDVDYGTFFEEAPCMNPNCHKITGSICGVKVQEIEDPLMQKIRYLDKLVDELTKGKPIEKILRK